MRRVLIVLYWHMNDTDLDLNIDNYSFADVLRLFRLDGSKPVEDRDLKRCRATVDKLHPARSSLSGAYYELFNSAYAVLYKRTYGNAGAGADAADDAYDAGADEAPEGGVVGVGVGVGAAVGAAVGAGAYADAASTMPYGFYSVAQSKPRAQAAAAARQAASVAAQQDTAAAAAAHRATVAPSSSLLGGGGGGGGSGGVPQPYSTRMVTIHTEDRDVLKYPFENAFEVVLPTVIKNVLSVELVDIALPAFFYNVSNYLQNTKLWFSVPNYFTDPVEIAVPSGCYTPADLCAALINELNAATTKRLYALGVYVSPLTTYSLFSVAYNAIKRKFAFHNTQDGFILWFDRRSVYERDSSLPQYQFECWKMLRNWGLGYTLGFYKLAYEAVIAAVSPTGLNLNLNVDPDDISLSLTVSSAKIAELDVGRTIYMEVDTFNWIDEIAPFSIATTDAYNGDFNGSVNSAFAKLALSTVSGCYVPVKKFKRVLPHAVEKVGRLKFKFRYHNGIPVDFKHQPFDFSLKFECRFN